MSIYYRKLGYDPFQVAIPVTFHIKNQSDPEFQSFIRYYNNLAKNKHANVWIIKPGENSNRGNGIECADTLSEIKSLIH